MKRALLVLALALFAAGGLTARAQDSGKVGPSAEDPRSDTAAKKSDEKTDEKANAKNNTPAAQRSARDTNAQKRGNNRRAQQPQRDAAIVSANVPKTSDSDPPVTSDAPPKKDNASLPVAQPKSTLSIEKEPAENSAGSNAPSPNGHSASSTADTNTNNWTPPVAPLPTSIYRVGVGDVLDIKLFNQPARESTLYTVMGGGLIEYALAGDAVNVVGMTTDEIGVRLASEIRRRGVYDKNKTPQVFVTVREYASHTVLVSGLVNEPGVKVLRREAIPLYVIVAEAQPKPEAGRAVVMSHATGQMTSVDLSDTQALNMLVYPSDVVNVVIRPQEFFYIGGEVGSPGQKSFYVGMTLTQAVLASGGATRSANGIVRVSRQGADGRLSSTEYKLQLIQTGKVPDPVVKAGDRIEVERK